VTQGHRALIVEDEPEIAADLGELILAVYPDAEIEFVDNKEHALAVLASKSFCFVLLDLRIKRDPSSLRGTVEAGMSVLVELRRTHPAHTGHGFSLPVIVVTASVPEREAAVGIMRDGASDVIAKPFGTDTAERIRACMLRSGRADHDACTSPVSRIAAAPAARLKIEIPATAPERPKTRVLFGETALTLPVSLLYPLLQLIVAHLQRGRVSAKDIGIANRGHQVISELRGRLRTAQVGGDNIIENANRQYWLREDIEIGDIDAETLRSLDERRVDQILEEIQKIRTALP
jgi:CheY-like chemotaxis protein